MHRRAWLAASALVLAAPSALAEPSARACIAANEQAIELRRTHALRAAREKLLACADPACPGEIRGECERQLAEVTRALPTVVLAAKDPAGRDLVRVRVLVDGAVVAESIDGAPLALDPGVHVFRFEARGEPASQTRVVLREGEKDRPIRVVLGAVEPAAAAPARRSPPFRVGGVTIAGVGLAAIAAGAVLGALASDAWSRSQAECRTPTDCADHASAVRDHDLAASLATASTAAIAIGGVAVVAGGVLFFAAPTIRPGPHPAAFLSVGARF